MGRARAPRDRAAPGFSSCSVLLLCLSKRATWLVTLPQGTLPIGRPIVWKNDRSPFLPAGQIGSLSYDRFSSSAASSSATSLCRRTLPTNERGICSRKRTCRGT